jgi:hypothetical protein
MFSRVRIAIRFFFMGLAVGILLAPRSGTETRRLVRERADRILNDVLDAATLGTYDDGSASDAATAVDAEAAAPKTGNGRGRGSRATSTASTAGA